MASTFPSASQGSDGFFADVSGVEARRQLRMSVGVVVMLAAGIVSAAFAIGTHPIAARRDVASTTPVTVLHAETAAVGARAI